MANRNPLTPKLTKTIMSTSPKRNNSGAKLEAIKKQEPTASNTNANSKTTLLKSVITKGTKNWYKNILKKWSFIIGTCCFELVFGMIANFFDSKLCF